MSTTRIATLVIGIGLGAAYGVASYFAFEKLDGLHLLGFVGFVPAGMGAAPLLLSDDDLMKNFVYVLFAPVAAVMTWATALFAVGREAGLCLLILSLPFLA